MKDHPQAPINPDRLVAFDIETEGSDDAVDFFTKDFGDFDPASVKVGNLKDEAKIAEKIATAEADHDFRSREYWESAYDKAALSAITGKVCAIGFKITGGYSAKLRTSKHQVDEEQISERDLLLWFWRSYHRFYYNLVDGLSHLFVGWNIYSFDLPFLIKRSWANGIAPPSKVMEICYHKSHFKTTHMVDLMLQFSVGDWQNRFFSLDKAGHFLGCGSKSTATTGKGFAELLDQGEEERERAAEYLRRDCELTFDIARMIMTEGII